MASAVVIDGKVAIATLVVSIRDTGGAVRVPDVLTDNPDDDRVKTADARIKRLVREAFGSDDVRASDLAFVRDDKQAVVAIAVTASGAVSIAAEHFTGGMVALADDLA